MKLTMITIFYTIGMLVWLLWKFGRKKDSKKIMDEIYEINGINIYPENLVILAVVICAVLVSALWPVVIVTYPYERLKKSKKSS